MNFRVKRLISGMGSGAGLVWLWKLLVIGILTLGYGTIVPQALADGYCVNDVPVAGASGSSSTLSTVVVCGLPQSCTDPITMPAWCINLFPPNLQLSAWTSSSSGAGSGGSYPSPTVTPDPSHCQTPQAPSLAENMIDNNESVGPNGLDGGYVPGQGTGAGASSGVTIGYGCDLAQRSVADLQAAGVSLAGQNAASEYLESKVPWYDPNSNGGLGLLTWKYVIGPTGTNAQGLLSTNGGLTLSSADVTAMDNFSYDNAVNQVEGQIGFTAYTQMPELLQDVLADVAYASGSLPYAMVKDIASKTWSNLGNDIQNIPNMT